MQNSLEDANFYSENVEQRLPTDLVYFKQTHVTIILRIVLMLARVTDSISVLWQHYQSKRDPDISQDINKCPLHHKCECPVRFQVRKTIYKFVLMVSGHHDSRSHKLSKGKYLSNTQKTALRQAVKCAPTETARQFRRNMDNLRSDQQIPHELLRSALQVVRKAEGRDSVFICRRSGVGRIEWLNDSVCG